jgi:hypothetical protein
MGIHTYLYCHYESGSSIVKTNADLCRSGSGALWFLAFTDLFIRRVGTRTNLLPLIVKSWILILFKFFIYVITLRSVDSRSVPSTKSPIRRARLLIETGFVPFSYGPGFADSHLFINGSGSRSCSFSVTFKTPTKIFFISQVFAYYFLTLHSYIILQR